MGRGASTNSIPEIENARFLLVIGSNTTEAHPVLALRMKKAVRNGATLVVADPRKIWLTKIAKRHLQLRPGTDVWLINAMMHVILEEGLQDEDYIREHTEDFDARARGRRRATRPRRPSRSRASPAEDIRATAREYATERHAAIFYTLGITEHACAVDNIWSLSNLVLMTGHLGYESTGLNALRGQNNVQGLNDSGANPSYLPGYQPVDEPEVRAKFSEAWGVELPETPGYRLDQIISGLHDGRIKALYLIGENPAHTEPNAHHVEEGLASARVRRLAGPLPQRADGEVRRRRLPGVELRREGRHVHEHRAAGEPRPRGRAVPGRGARGPRHRRRRSRARWAPTGPSTRTRSRSGTRSPTSSPNWYGIRYDRLEEQGMQWPCPDRDHPGTPFLHAPRPARPGGEGKFFPVEYQPPIEQPDSEYPLVALHRPHALPLQLGDDDDARGRDHGQAGGPVLRDLGRGRVALGLAEGDWARLVSRRGDARGARARSATASTRASSGWRSTSRRRR